MSSNMMDIVLPSYVNQKLAIDMIRFMHIQIA